MPRYRRMSADVRRLSLALIGGAVLFSSVPAEAGTLTASWIDNSFGLATTRLERRLSTDTAFQTLVDVPPGASSYADRSVVTGSTYCYRAFAYDAEGQSPYSDEACGTAVDCLDLSVSRQGTGSGTVTSIPSGINCGTTCAGSFVGGSVTISAAASQGSFFAGWGGSMCSGTDACTLAGNIGAVVTATFTEVRYTLSVTKTGLGTIVTNPAGISCGSACAIDYPAGTQVALSATPGTGYVFGGWSGACSGTAGCTVAMNAPASVSATFVPPLTATCSVTTGEVAVAYSGSCTGTGGLAPYSCTLAAGTLPAGLALGSSCSLGGTPTTPGTSSFTVKVADSAGHSVNVAKSLTIAPVVAVTTAMVPVAKLNLAYSTTLAAANGVKPYTWSVNAGTLPAGLTLNATTGAITGIPTVLGTSDFT